LFWLSLFPVTTAWIGENHLAAQPSALYGAVLLMAAVALLWLVPDRRIERVLAHE
jgi:uncharacterized membrane protein